VFYWTVTSNGLSEPFGATYTSNFFLAKGIVLPECATTDHVCFRVTFATRSTAVAEITLYPHTPHRSPTTPAD